VTHLRRIMLEELQRRSYADSTARYYLRAVEQFARHFGKSGRIAHRVTSTDHRICARRPNQSDSPFNLLRYVPR
jgi:hypothetical protein